MSKCPCPKHKEQFINYLSYDMQNSNFSCQECLLEDGFFYQDMIDVEKSLKQPEEILIHLNQNSHEQELIKAIFKFDEIHFKSLISEYEKKVNLFKEKLTADLVKFKFFTEGLIKIFQNFRTHISKLIDHDGYKQIVATFQEKNKQLNPTAFQQSKESINSYFTKVAQNKEAFSLTQTILVSNKTGSLSQNLYTGDALNIKLKFQEIIKYSMFVNLLNIGQLRQSSFLPAIDQTITSKLNKKIKSLYPIYMSIKDGLQINNLWDKIDGKDHLIMYFKSGSQHVFGGYSPCKWGKTINYYVQDSTLASFIFSQTNFQIFPLKSDKEQYAIYCGQQSYGPYFGQGDISISTAYTVNGASPINSYENKTGQTIQLHGGNATIIECEIYQVIFE